MRFTYFAGVGRAKSLAVAAVVAVAATASHSATINVSFFDVASYNAATTSGYMEKAREDFESFSVGEVGANFSTSVGTFNTIGGTGTGGTVKGLPGNTGTELAVRSGNVFGRSSTTAELGACPTVCPGNFLDSNDTFGITWDVALAGGSLFERIVFVMTDASDAGARLTIKTSEGGVAVVNPGQADGNRRLVVIDFGTRVSFANVTLENSKLNDGLSIDDISVGVVPLPASALLLLGGLGGLAAMKRRRKAA